MKPLRGSSVRNILQGVLVHQLYTKLMRAGELGPSSNQIRFLYGQCGSGDDQLVCKTVLDTGRNKTNTPYYVIGIVAL